MTVTLIPGDKHAWRQFGTGENGDMIWLCGYCGSTVRKPKDKETPPPLRGCRQMVHADLRKRKERMLTELSKLISATLDPRKEVS